MHSFPVKHSIILPDNSLDESYKKLFYIFVSYPLHFHGIQSPLYHEVMSGAVYSPVPVLHRCETLSQDICFEYILPLPNNFQYLFLSWFDQQKQNQLFLYQGILTEDIVLNLLPNLAANHTHLSKHLFQA